MTKQTIDQQEVLRIAKLARLELEPEEVDGLAATLAQFSTMFTNSMNWIRTVLRPQRTQWNSRQPCEKMK